MHQETIEKRSHFRRDFANPIEFVLDGHGPTPFKGATINISATGFCFFAFSPIEQGQSITIVKSVLPLSRKRGEVIWSRKVDSDFYKIGLVFKDM